MTSPRPPIDLSQSGSGNFHRSRSRVIEALWILVEVLFVRNSLQPSSRLRAVALRLFGASVGTGVILRPGVRVKFPWLLRIGDNCWIGEDVWFHNQDRIEIEENVVISQGSFVTTGSHDHRTTMDLTVAPVRIRRGAWIASRCIVLRGVDVGENTIVTPGGVVYKSVAADGVYGGSPLRLLRPRWTNDEQPSRES